MPVVISTQSDKAAQLTSFWNRTFIHEAKQQTGLRCPLT